MPGANSIIVHIESEACVIEINKTPKIKKKMVNSQNVLKYAKQLLQLFI